MIENSIAQSAARLRLSVLALMIILGLLYGAAGLGLDVGGMRFDYRHHVPTAEFARIASHVSMALLGLALFRLTQMLRAIADGDYFSAQVVERFRGFAFWLLAMALLGAVAPILVGLLDRRSGHAALTLRLDVREVLTAGITLILFLLAKLLERARELDAEMREIV